ncbi:hypothetical protein GCM10010123_38160 [Pilimelia anulata]|uniref:Uncharacterized protein n=1 Tax=Pilimelia anulata TaxID=53371 RepID=A0A8J3B943_9ACTN|nr:hypothetical protein [Pilimelia anulata]GGK04583.1 hypothetical protein GCM10010123_38160 [Pilimelia anulata]
MVALPATTTWACEVSWYSSSSTTRNFRHRRHGVTSRTRPPARSRAGWRRTSRYRYTEPAERAAPRLGLSPYVGEGYALQEREPGDAPWPRNIHLPVRADRGDEEDR